VVLVTLALLGGLRWYFFGPRPEHVAQLSDGVQRVEVTVRRGYQPNLIRVRQGVPAELVSDRQESGECTSRVVFPDLADPLAADGAPGTTRVPGIRPAQGQHDARPGSHIRPAPTFGPTGARPTHIHPQ